MFKKIMLALAVVAVAVLVVSATYVTAHAQDTQAAEPVAQLPIVKGSAPAKDTGANYYDIERLQDDVVSAYNTTPPVKRHAQSATCVIDGRKAICLLRTATVNIVENVSISADGKTFIAIARENN